MHQYEILRSSYSLTATPYLKPKFTFRCAFAFAGIRNINFDNIQFLVVKNIIRQSELPLALHCFILSDNKTCYQLLKFGQFVVCSRDAVPAFRIHSTPLACRGWDIPFFIHIALRWCASFFVLLRGSETHRKIDLLLKTQHQIDRNCPNFVPN